METQKSLSKIIGDVESAFALVADMAAILTDDDITPEEKLSCESQINEMIEECANFGTEIEAKAAGTIAVIQQTTARADDYKTLAEKANDRAKALENIVKRIKQRCVENINALALTTGKKQIGAAGAILAVQKNGGVEPLDIPDPLHVPYEMHTYTLKCTYEQKQKIEAAIGNDFKLIIESKEIDRKKIRESLSRHGVTANEYAQLLPREEHLRIRV